MRALYLLLSVILLSICFASLHAAIIRVPADQPTIQAGIDASVDSDTVLVAEGTYTGDGNRDIDFLGKAILVVSENGPDVTIIDCEGDSLEHHRGFSFQNGEDFTSVVQGFTIMNGWAIYGGGIRCHNSSPTIRGNILRDNTANWNDGGGIDCSVASSPIIEDNIIFNNAAKWAGGGISSVFQTAPIIQPNIIRDNSAKYGGGIYCGNSFLSIIKGNIISGNRAEIMGGGYHGENDDEILINNTITGNSAELGGGIACGSYSDVIVSNSIIWGNDAQEGSEIYVGQYDLEPATLTINYSDVENGQDSVYVVEGCTLNWGDGMIDEDPMFVFPEERDYRLLWDSPCIDTGHQDSLDADGTQSDMGAHYFNQLDYLTLYITPDMIEVAPGEELSVTYTAINRWGWSQPFWALSRVALPGGMTGVVQGPKKYTLPAHYTAQFRITHDIPTGAPAGTYNYWSGVGLPPGIVFDDDSFTFTVTE